MDLQFASDQAFVSRRGPLPAFTRASAATRVNSAGLVVSAAINEARIDYNPTTLACSGLLLEEARTNLCIHSENLSAANWGKSNVAVTSDTSVAPNGLSTADVVAETAVSGFHLVSTPSMTPASGTAYSISVFLKKGPGATAPDWIILGTSNQFPAFVVAFNVLTGQFGNVVGGASATYKAVQYANGWWRVSIVITASGSSVTPPLTIYFSNNTNTASAPSYLGNTTSNVLIWGAQVEVGAFPTSYIPTTTASVTRGADALEITGANFSNFWNQSEGTLVLEMQKAYSANSAISQLNYLSVNDGTATNYIQFAQRGQGVSGEVFRVEFGGASQVLMAAGATASATGPINAINTPFRIGGAYKVNNFASAINGSDSSVDVTGNIPTLTQLQFVTFSSANHIRSLQYYSVRKTNAELTRLTQLSTLDPALTLDLQFALDAVYFSRRGPTPAFTRASSGRFVGPAGLIQVASTNVPRIDYDPITLRPLGLLIEEQRTNLTVWSEDATNAGWGKLNVTATGNTAVAPDGNSGADTLSETVANAQHYFASPSVSISSGTSYTTSVFLKKGAGATAPDWIIISFLAGAFGSKAVAFNVSTGAVGASAGGQTASVTQFPNGWWRVSMTATAVASLTTPGLYLAFTNNTNTISTPTYAGQTTSDLFVWGAQFEAGSFASSYIPTTTTSLVRSADVCSITGAAFTGFYNQTEGTVALKYIRPTTANCTVSSFDDGTAIERLANLLSSGVERFSPVDGANANNLDRTAGAINTVIGHAARYKNLDFAFAANASAVTTSTVQTVPTVTQLALGQRLSGNYLNGHIAAFQYFNAIKTNAQLQTLSTP